MSDGLYGLLVWFVDCSYFFLLSWGCLLNRCILYLVSAATIYSSRSKGIIIDLLYFLGFNYIQLLSMNRSGCDCGE